MSATSTPTLGYLPKAALVAGALAAVLAWPAWKLQGEAGVWGLLAGIGTALIGAVLGHLPRFFIQPSPHALAAAGLAGIGVRLFSTMLLAGALLLLTPLPREAVALGLLFTYLSLLALEIRELVRLGQAEADRVESAREGVDGVEPR